MSEPNPIPSSLRVPRWWPVWVGVVALLAASAWLRLGGPDEQVFRAVNALGAMFPAFWASLSVAGLGLSVWILWVAACPGVSVDRMRAVSALFWCFPLGGMFTHVFKTLFAMPRPQAVLPLDQIQVIGAPLMHNSMPSGHALTAMAAAWLWLHVQPRRPSAWIVTMLLMGGVVVSRLTTAAHWPSDVLAGMALGWLAAQISLMLTQRWSLTARLSGAPGQWVLACLQVVCGVSMATSHTGYPMAWLVQWGLAAVGVASGVWRLVQWRERSRRARDLAAAA